MKRKAALENQREATETCTEPQGDMKRFNEAHEPRVTVRKNLLFGKTLRLVSAEGQEEGEAHLRSSLYILLLLLL